MKTDSIQKAINHYRCKICLDSMSAWKKYHEISIKLKNNIADEFNEKRIINNYFTLLKKSKKLNEISYAKASRFYHHKLKLSFFNKINDFTKSEAIIASQHQTLAEAHDAKRLILKYFRTWKNYPLIIKNMRIREKRLGELRLMAREIVPDYDLT